MIPDTTGPLPASASTETGETTRGQLKTKGTLAEPPAGYVKLADVSRACKAAGIPVSRWVRAFGGDRNLHEPMDPAFAPVYVGRTRTRWVPGEALTKLDLLRAVDPTVPSAAKATEQTAEQTTEEKDARHHRAWIFQANPRKFDLVGALKTLGDLTWLVNQHESEIHALDRVYLWLSGPDGGIRAIATVLADPESLIEGPSEARFELDHTSFDGSRSRVRLRVDRVLKEPISRARLLEHPTLKDLRIIKFARQTNYALSAEDTSAIESLITSAAVSSTPGRPAAGRVRGIGTRPVPSTAPTLPKSFEGLMAVLESSGLHFPVEVVSTYLLALQCKRFVILTGISGTGKTQLAMAVARYFQSIVTSGGPPPPPLGALPLKVHPYMVKYHLMVLPRSLTTNLRLTTPVADAAANHFDVVYPGGKTKLSFFHDSGRSVTHLFFNFHFRTWFDKQLTLGDSFYLDVDPADDNASPHKLRFTVPGGTVTKEPMDTFRVVAVRPDWTDNHGLLGYYNPLTNHYTITPFLELLLKAREEFQHAVAQGRVPHPFFVILDEMNLAQVEHYFSDFLSCLESGEPVDLHDDAALEAGETEDSVAIPRRLAIPPNLLFTGTVNVDETTSMFSPKVLDRAFTIELDRVELESYGRPLDEGTRSASPLFLRKIPDPFQCSDKPDTDGWRAFGDLLHGKLRSTVLSLNRLLTEDHRQFGYRVANEMARFVNLAAAQAGDSPETLWTALDLAVLQKVLPKFHGTQQELESVLEKLFAFSLGAMTVASPSEWRSWRKWEMANGDIIIVGTTAPPLGDIPRLIRSSTKLWRMLQRLNQQGFTSFIE